LSDAGNNDSDALDDENGSDDEAPATYSYSTLLQTLNAGQTPYEPLRKRRKLSNDQTPALLEASLDSTSTGQVPTGKVRSPKQEVKDDDEGQEHEADEEETDTDSDPELDDEATGADPFQQHFSGVDEKLLAAGVASLEAKQIINTRITVMDTSITNSSVASWPARDLDMKDFPMKQRLEASAAKLTNKLSKSERHIASSVFCYRDVVCGTRTLKNAGQLRDVAALHALNHVFKTRDRVIKNNSKLAQQADQETLDLRDQGFTRPKVLIVLPTRNACVKFVESIVRLGQPEQQENKSRFTAGFTEQDENNWEDKPEDFQDLFGGNDDDMFRLGLKFTRKTIKYFSAFYNSDIILASPLGLMRAIEGASDKDEKKKHDADFLSSIEIVIVDHTNALLMQNWQHVEYIFSQLNLLPKEPHGCDFSRVRNWYLDGNARYLRQTIILSDYLSPEINSLVSKHLHNIADSTKYKAIYPGAMLNLPPTLPSGISQTFTRFNSPNPSADSDARFMQFSTTILPSLLQSHSHKLPTVVYLPTYADFVRVRNHFSTSQTTASLSFGTISEYTSVRDVARARSHFLSGRHSVLLYTERAHHFRRYNIRGAKRVVFYGVPENPRFWPEVVGFLASREIDEKIAKGAVRAIFSKWDVLKLERIVGTERVGRLISEKGGDTFEFT
jgi:U3 small nucleolar RNA-associated protein 25